MSYDHKLSLPLFAEKNQSCHLSKLGGRLEKFNQVLKQKFHDNKEIKSKDSIDAGSGRISQSKLNTTLDTPVIKFAKLKLNSKSSNKLEYEKKMPKSEMVVQMYLHLGKAAIQVRTKC